MKTKQLFAKSLTVFLTSQSFLNVRPIIIMTINWQPILHNANKPNENPNELN
jgi:hypothetical protein